MKGETQCKKFGKILYGYEGLYQVSNLGRTKSLKRKFVKEEKILTYTKNKKGYLQVSLTKNGKTKTERVNRLVAKTFIPNPKNLPQVNHIDGNKLDNSIENLEWCDCKYNINEAWKIGLNKKRFGRENNRSRKVEQYDLNGNFIRTWDTIKQAADKLKINTANIIACCQGKYKKSHGFIWRYEE